MKKLIVLSLLFIFFGSFQVIKATPVAVAYEFEVVDGYGYDLETGIYEENVVLSSTTKMVINSANIGYELNLISLNFHHLLFFDEYNRYIGYINGNNSTYENEKYLGYDATAITNYPLNTHSFTFVNYNYDNIRNQVVVINPTIDDVAYDTLSYRDIFGNSLFGVSTNNLINNGDFSNTDLTNYGSPGWNLEVESDTLKATVDTVITYDYVGYNTSLYEDHTYYSYIDEYITHELDGAHYFRISGLINGIPLDRVYNEWDSLSDIIVNTGDSSTMVFYNAGTTTNIGDISYYDNFMLFDLTAIFDPLDLGNTLPTLEEFETMLTFYELYVDAPEELTYNDIFENTNLIINGDFSDVTDYLDFSVGTRSTITSDYGELELVPNGTSNFPYIAYNSPLIGSHNYYIGFDYKMNLQLYYSIPPLDTIKWNNGVTNIYINDTYFTDSYRTISFINEQPSSVSDYIFYFENVWSSTNAINYLDNLKSYDLTTIFSYGLEPNILTFETYYSVWLDPLGDYYTAYYTAGHLLGLGISYYYEPVIPTELSVDNGIDNFLDNINMNTTAGKAGIGLIFMIIIAVLIGLLTKSRPITIISLITAFLGFTVIGWFSVWIVIVISIFLVIFALLKMKD